MHVALACIIDCHHCSKCLKEILKQISMKNTNLYNGIIIQQMDSLYRFIGDDMSTKKLYFKITTYIENQQFKV